MNNKEQIIKDLEGIFSKTQLKQVNIEYSDRCGGEIEITGSESVMMILDNEKSKLFSKFKDVMWEHDLSYDFRTYRCIVVYED